MSRFNWAGNYEYRAPTLAEPRTLQQVQDAVGSASSISPLGTRHSFNDIADSANTQLSVAGLPARLDIDEATRTVTVSAGERYGEFVSQLHTAGWAIHNLASLPHISVAGAIATGTHGSGDRNGALATAVAGLEFVAADGSLQHASRGDAHFEGMVVSLGALGVVTAVELEIEPTFDVRQDLFENLPLSELQDNFDAITSSAYSVSIFTDWGQLGATSVWLKSRMNTDTSAADGTTFFGATKAEHTLHMLADGPTANVTQQGGIPGPWWNRLAHFKLEFTPSNGDEMQTEYLLDRSHAPDAIDAIRRLQPQIAPYLLISELRTMSADQLWMSPAYGYDTLGIHFTWKNAQAVYGLLPAIDAALAPFAARPHWGKVFDTDTDRLASLYPRIGDFRALAARLDPCGKFRNAYLDRTVFARALR